MPTPIEVVEAEAMKLTPRERAELADRLWMSAEPNSGAVDAACVLEIEQRIRQIDAGEVVCVPWEHVVAEMRARYG